MASGTRALARAAIAPTHSGLRFNSWPMRLDSRTIGPHPLLADRGEPGEGSGHVRPGTHQFGQDRGVFKALAAALAQVRPHRMGGVADDDDRTLRPLFGRLAVVDVVADDITGVSRFQKRGNRLRPLRKPRPEVRELVLVLLALGHALGREPVGVVGPERHVPDLCAGPQCLAGQIGVHADTGNAAPCGVTGVAVVEGTVQPAGHDRACPVGTDQRRRLVFLPIGASDANRLGARGHTRGRDAEGHSSGSKCAGQDIRERSAAQHHQWFAERLRHAVGIRMAERSAIAPTHRSGGDTPAGRANGVAQPDAVEGSEGVGPDADRRSKGSVGPLLDDAD